MNNTEIKIADLQALLADLRSTAVNTERCAQGLSNQHLRDYAQAVAAKTQSWADELRRIVGEA